MSERVTTHQKLEEIYHSLFDDNRYEVLTSQGWQATTLVSVFIGSTIIISVDDPLSHTFITFHSVEEACNRLRRPR